MGSGVFLVFGIVARKGAAAGLQADPVPQAMVITGIVVAFAASALAVALVLRLFSETGQVTLNPDAWAEASRRRSQARMTAGVSAIAATAGGGLLPLAILLPALGVLMSLLLGGRNAERIALGLMPVELAVAVAIAYFVWRSGQPLVYTLAGYTPPLGIALRADGFSAVMLVTAGVIAPAAALYARTTFATPPESTEKRAPLVFWTLLQGIQAALSLIFLGGDLFNLYVGLELLTFAAVPLVSLDGRAETVAAALRYLLFALFGWCSICSASPCSTAPMARSTSRSLAPLIRPEPAVWLAAGLMTAGLLAKTALFPLHLWLPPAHANAPAAASAVLSGWW